MRTNASDPMDEPIFDPHEYAAVCFAQSHGARDDRVENGLWVRRRGADHSQNLRRGRLLGSRRRKLLVEVADPGALVLGRLAGNRGLGFLGLRRLLAPTHRLSLPPMNRSGAS